MARVLSSLLYNLKSTTRLSGRPLGSHLRVLAAAQEEVTAGIHHVPYVLAQALEGRGHRQLDLQEEEGWDGMRGIRKQCDVA